jgi:superfamily II DNA or RNA helicase
MSYQSFVNRKLETIAASGLAEPFTIPESLFPMQRDLVAWALKRGRSAIFADTGLGKTRMQVAWADEVHRRTGGDVLILAPLAVAAQTVMEGAEIGVNITHCRELDDVQPGINITNYDRLHKFDSSRFVGVVLDESSCIKHHTAKTFDIMVEAFAATPYRLCATATPAPNDWTELGTHAEFLGVCSRSEMLAEFFVHDGGETQTWRLKGHARHMFWKWVSKWGACIRKPSDLGYDDSAYRLPPLNETEHLVDVDESALVGEGMLFAFEARSLTERRAARKESMEARVKACADMVNADSEPWIIWGEYNAETEALRSLIPGAVEIAGPDTAEHKEKCLADFASGRIRVLITKPSIAGWGLNWQHCARMAFVGVSDSFESYYQAVRRCYRFGQKREVHVHLFSSQLEGAVLANLRRKEQDAQSMGESLAAETSAAVKAAICGTAKQTNDYNASRMVQAPSWLRSECA